jgi:hypothetical protein
VFNVAIVGIVVGLFGIGIVAHRAMGVRTTVDRWMGGWVDGDGGLVVVADEKGVAYYRPPAPQGIHGPGTDIIR